jgi:multidrug efflux pump subunit AcrA (membrane-fusion protein)
MSDARPVEWERFSHDPRAKQNAVLRASDADRNVALDSVSAAYADGRLDREEYDERSSSVQEAKTLGDLLGHLRDLTPDSGQAGLVAATPAMLQHRAEEAYLRIRQGALASFLLPTLVCWVIWALTSYGKNGFEPYFPWPVFVMLGTGVRLIMVTVNRQQLLEQQQRRIEKHERRRIERRPR